MQILTNKALPIFTTLWYGHKETKNTKMKSLLVVVIYHKSWTQQIELT